MFKERIINTFDLRELIPESIVQISTKIKSGFCNKTKEIVQIAKFKGISMLGEAKFTDMYNKPLFVDKNDKVEPVILTEKLLEFLFPKLASSPFGKNTIAFELSSKCRVFIDDKGEYHFSYKQSNNIEQRWKVSYLSNVQFLYFNFNQHHLPIL